MINIKIEKKGDEYEIKAEGHAMFCPGNDIVCASVSCLFYTLLGFLGNCKGVCHSFEMKSGDAHILAKGDMEQAFEMFVIGLLQIEKSYPDNVKVCITDI